MLTSREWICVHTCLRLVFSIVARFYLCIACVSFVRTRFTSIKIISLLNALFYLRAHINWSCIRTRIRKYVKTLYRSNGRRSTQKKYKPIWISSKSFVSFSLSVSFRNVEHEPVFISKRKIHILSNGKSTRIVSNVSVSEHIKTTTNKWKMESFKVIYSPLCATLKFAILNGVLNLLQWLWHFQRHA